MVVLNWLEKMFNKRFGAFKAALLFAIIPFILAELYAFPLPNIDNWERVQEKSNYDSVSQSNVVARKDIWGGSFCLLYNSSSGNYYIAAFQKAILFPRYIDTWPDPFDINSSENTVFGWDWKNYNVDYVDGELIISPELQSIPYLWDILIYLGITWMCYQIISLMKWMYISDVIHERKKREQEKAQEAAKAAGGGTVELSGNERTDEGEK